MNVPVNLATLPVETHRRFLAVSGILLGFSGILFFWLGWHVYSVRKADRAVQVQRESAAAEIASLIEEREQLVRFFSQPENAKLHDRASFINSIIDAQSFNWTRMFMDLERVLPGGVHVMNVEPKQVNGQAIVMVTVGAASEQARNDFLNSLEQSNAFSHVELTRVEAASKDAGGDQLVMNLTVAYSGQ
jgi:Tfp pilus assembly protein PilN